MLTERTSPSTAANSPLHTPAQAAASGADTMLQTSKASPLANAPAIGSQTAVLISTAMGLKMWNRAMTRGKVRSQIVPLTSVNRHAATERGEARGEARDVLPPATSRLRAAAVGKAASAATSGRSASATATDRAASPRMDRTGPQRGVIPRRHCHPRRGNRHQAGDTEEGKLRPDVEQVHRIEDEDDKAGQGQYVETDAAAADVCGPAGPDDQHRRANDRRLGIDQQHVQDRESGHGGQTPSPGQQPPQDQSGQPGKDAEVEPRDDQEVDRAGQLEGLDFLRIELFAEAQQDGRGEVCLLRAEVGCEDLPAACP